MTEARRALKPNGSVILNIRPHVRDGQISDYVLRTRLALRESGWAEIEELIWDKKGGAPMGHTGRPRRSWESLLWFGKHGRIFCDPKAAGVASQRVGGLDGGRRGPHVHGEQKTPAAGRARVSDIVAISTRKNENNNAMNQHPAAFPVALAEWAGSLICPPGGTILDPFSGSASTGVAAIRNGWDYIGIDAVAEYVDMSRKRLDKECEQLAA
jgi:DNA modification methylase